MIMKKLQDLFQISDAATADLGRGILACTLTNVVTLLSVLVVVLVFQEILAPLDGGEVSWERLWMLFGAGLVIMVLSYFCSRNDYRKTYVSCYTAAEDSRLRHEDQLHQQHIADRATCDGKEHLSSPEMQGNDHENGDELWGAVPPLRPAYVPEAVHDEQAEDGSR